jgi:hypothetical protein
MKMQTMAVTLDEFLYIAVIEEPKMTSVVLSAAPVVRLIDVSIRDQSWNLGGNESLRFER